MSHFPEIDIFLLFCLFWSNILHAITSYGISSLWRDIWAPSVHCLKLIFKDHFYFRKLQPQFPKNCLFYTGQFAARYRLKSIRQKDKSIVLRWTSAHSLKICYIAELFPASRVPCSNDKFCMTYCKNGWWYAGHCIGGVCVCNK